MTESFADTVRGLQGKILTELMADLVRIPSLSGDEARIMAFAADYLAARGLDVAVLGRKPDQPNVVATLGTGESPVVVLNGHLDTVPPAAPEQWRTDPFEPVAANDRVYGLGALDMKGSCAAMMLALLALKQHADKLNGTVQLQLVCEEEAGAYYGTPYLVELIQAGQLPKPDHVIVGEYTGLQVMNAERGSFKFEIDFHGRATHTATARVEGQNAIYAAARAICLIERNLDIRHPEVGQAVISVNQIRGGQHRSQVPDECTVLVDRRMVPGETMESVMAETATLIESLREDIPWLDFKVGPSLDDRGQPRYSPPNLTRRGVQSAEAIIKAHRHVTGKPAQYFTGWFGATDARCFRYEGYDSINYGPDGLHAHGPNEYVLVDTLNTQLAVVALAVADLCGFQT